MSSVRLRPLESEDVPTVVGLLAHPDLVGRRGLDNDRPVARSAAALTKVVKPMVDPEHGETWVADADGMIGVVMVDWWWDSLTPWLHVVIAPDHQRQGHGTSAAGMALDHLFEMTPAAVVQFGVPSWDDGGLAFAASLGGESAGRNRRAGVRHGAYFDLVEFFISRAMWEPGHAARG